jgi:hypothetical protein
VQCRRHVGALARDFQTNIQFTTTSWRSPTAAASTTAASISRGGSFEEEENYSSDDEIIDGGFADESLRIRENDPDNMTYFIVGGGIQNLTVAEWDVLGKDIANITHLEELALYDGALKDHKMSFFRGLTRSSTIQT